MTSPEARILFLADAGPSVGGGHVMRCLTLARALEARGAACSFVESAETAKLLARFHWQVRNLRPQADADDLPRLVAYAGRLAVGFDATIVVVDHYRLTAPQETFLRDSHRKIVSIDDLADRKHDCDLLVDPGFGRNPKAYAGLAPESCQLLTGPDYALVRPEFADARPRALSRRASHGPVKRVLVSLGLTDVGGVTAKVVEALLPKLGDHRLDVAVGGGAVSLERLGRIVEADRRVHLHVDSDEMATLMADADVAVGAGGSSSWERCCMGLPTVTLVLADNQAEVARRLDQADVTVAVDARNAGFESALMGAWALLMDDPDVRAGMARRSAELCDGRGVGRVADQIVAMG